MLEGRGAGVVRVRAFERVECCVASYEHVLALVVEVLSVLRLS